MPDDTRPISTIRKAAIDTDKTDLETPFTLEYIKNAITKMTLNKTPGPDGFTT